MADQQIVEAIQAISRRLDNLEAQVRRIEGDSGRWNNVAGLHPIAMNLSEIREMFLLEILRQKGALDGIDLAKIQTKVSERLAGKSIPWGGPDSAKAEYPAENVEKARHEIEGDYHWTPERFR